MVCHPETVVSLLIVAIIVCLVWIFMNQNMMFEQHIWSGTVPQPRPATSSLISTCQSRWGVPRSGKDSCRSDRPAMLNGDQCRGNQVGVTPHDPWEHQRMEHVPGIEARVVQPAGVVSNISTPPGLLMSDVHVAESCAGAAMLLEHTNEAKKGPWVKRVVSSHSLPSTAIHCHPLPPTEDSSCKPPWRH